MSDRLTRDLLAALDAYEAKHGELEQASGLREALDATGDGPEPSPGRRAAREAAGEPPAKDEPKGDEPKDTPGKDFERASIPAFDVAKQRARARLSDVRKTTSKSSAKGSHSFGQGHATAQEGR